MQNLKIGNSFALETPAGNFMLIITNLEYDFSYGELLIEYDSINLTTREVKKEQRTLNHLKTILEKFNK